MRYEKMSKKYFQHCATLWAFCVIFMRNDGICPPAELADFRRKKHMQIRAIRGDTFYAVRIIPHSKAYGKSRVRK